MVFLQDYPNLVLDLDPRGVPFLYLYRDAHFKWFSVEAARRKHQSRRETLRSYSSTSGAHAVISTDIRQGENTG